MENKTIYLFLAELCCFPVQNLEESRSSVWIFFWMLAFLFQTFEILHKPCMFTEPDTHSAYT